VRRYKRRSGRGRVILVGILLVGILATGGWLLFGKRYFRVSQAQASAAGVTQDAATGATQAASEQQEASWKKPRVPSLDQLAGQDEVLRPRLGATSAVTADADSEPPRPEALERVEPPAPAQQQTTGESDASARDPAAETATGNAKIDAALKLLADGKLIEARHELNAILMQGLPRGEESEVRRQLTKIADDSIFSRRTIPGDPLAGSYTVQSGDRLVNISRDYKVPADILMYINGIKDATKLRAEQKIKVLRGPFHAKISKSQFRMDVYLQDLYVRSYRVGLGADQGTPEGVWKVKERLEHPTYYPPASSDIKRIIPPDDPENPLGNFWIGLEGVSGDAVGHTGYGMHGTIEPESIGRAVSLGCVRLLNDDVEFLYKLMLPGESTVTVLP
jgi:hypothetical protein